MRVATSSGATAPSAAARSLLEHWDHGQLLELASVINTFINIGRMGDTLGVGDPVLFTRDVT